MSNKSYPVPVQTIIQTLDELLANRGQDQLAELLRQADATVDWEGHDNWNDVVEYYVLNLRVPVAAFAGVEPKRDAIEKLLLQKAKSVTRQFDRDVISRVAIIPDSRLTGAPGAGQLSPEILRRIWEADGLHLFVSHRSEDKVAAVGLKKALVPYGVSAFVAHEDIEPNRVFQTEIERALASMHALVAMATVGFDSSVWCQQEIGFALGRGVPVIPLRLGADPSGFLGRIQAFSGDLTKVDELGSSVVDALLKFGRTSVIMRELLVCRFERVTSWEGARLLKTQLMTVSGFDEGQLARLENALTANEKVASAWGVPDAIRQLLVQHRNPASHAA